MEGTSEYFAFLAQKERGLIQQQDIDQGMVQAANECILLQKGRPLTIQQRHRNFRTLYTCGPVLVFFADQMVLKKHAGEKPGFLFIEMMRRARSRNSGTFSFYDFLETYESLMEDELAPARIEKVLHFGLAEGADTFFLDMLRDAGLQVRLADFSEVDVQDERSSMWRHLGMILARCDCEGKRISFSRTREAIRFDPLENCSLFRQGMQVGRVNGFDVFSQAGKAIHAVRQSIATGSPISLGVTGRDEDIDLKCEARALDPTYSRLLKLDARQGNDSTRPFDNPRKSAYPPAH